MKRRSHSPPPSLTHITILIAALALGHAPAAVGQPPASRPAPSGNNRRCLDCHGQRDITAYGVDDRRTMVALGPDEVMPQRDDLASLYVDRTEIGQGLHANFHCTACHRDAERLPHPPRLAAPQCATCHPQAAAGLLRSRHAEAALRSDPPAPKCWDCHGTHVIRPKTDRRSRVYPLEVIKVCGGCHQRHTTPEGGLESGAESVEAYLDSVHGRTIARAGLVVGATCADCHGHHEILPSSHPGSRVNRANIPQTCGRCHVGIDEVFETTVHAEAARNGRFWIQPPVCNDCHTSHQITHAETPEFMRDIVQECGTCHEDLYRTYRESYHGQVQQLGSMRAARCSDCHGTHNIRRVDDPASTLHASVRADTCGRCHEELNTMSHAGRENFIRYEPHADFRSKSKNPILFYIWLYFVIIISATLAFWGLHSLAWFARGAIERRRNGPRPRHQAGPHAIRRFSAWHRWTHALVMISFMGLTLTGVPLKFSDRPWAAVIMASFGGPDTAGLMHRCFAVLVLIYLVMHAMHLWRRRRDSGRSLLSRVFGPNSMMPNRADWRQFRQMMRWFLGRGAKPDFDRWTYWEKFDYWADVVGTFVIGGSGLLLCFPTFFAEYLSGFWFNVATVIHGYEALLAAAFIFSIHFFNAHLRWEKFPVDKVMFTGQISEEEFREERGLQYERLAASGGLDELRVPPAPAWQHQIAGLAAMVALAVGIALVLLIIIASLS